MCITGSRETSNPKSKHLFYEWIQHRIFLINLNLKIDIFGSKFDQMLTVCKFQNLYFDKVFKNYNITHRLMQTV